MRARGSLHGLTMKRPAHSDIDIRQSIHPVVLSLPPSARQRHGLGTPGWVVSESGLLTQTQPHRHALTHAPTHTSTHIHTYILLVLQVIPTTAQSLNVTSALACAHTKECCTWSAAAAAAPKTGAEQLTVPRDDPASALAAVLAT